MAKQESEGITADSYMKRKALDSKLRLELIATKEKRKYTRHFGKGSLTAQT